MGEIDFIIFQQINNLAGKFVYLDALGVFFAEYLGYILVGLVFLIPFFYKKAGWKIIFHSLLAGILARFGIVELIRFFWLRPRPFIENNVNLLVEGADKASFPSGHAAFFFAISFIVYQYNKKTGLLFFIASSLIAISRVFVGVHWPLDILAGAAVGVFSGWLIILFSRKLFSAGVK